ncbi:DDE domain-containing protein [Rhizobium leguminosarum bv. viciae]|nr:transposase-like protein [Rhizobium leguminosarum]NKK54229.1 DDE-type integrase/transposase/recombinase [Rhizobium leguminosarum bv. viciae]NKL39393.1 DDE-type integrase/transposase/recombinase [Rhizobium leguminosarum bv. viciae]TBY16710.1 DDE domain-containing protein [Rhizobium leguminosarum bv. viciae]TBY52519.1 DDE domain-containing protein [Rhizobium leguminosarum bv. viciae]
MSRALSDDLRIRVLAASSDGMSARSAAARFGIGISTAIAWIANARQGQLTAGKQGRRSGSRLDEHERGCRKQQQGIESDHFRVKKNMPKIGGFRSFNSARRTIAGFEAILWLRKGFGFSGGWTVNDQNDLLARLFGLQKVNKA